MGWELYVLKAVAVLLIFGGVLSVVPFLVFFERKISAFIQDRVGPNRVGLAGPDSLLEAFGFRKGTRRVLGGWLQPLADVIKLFTKEALIPAHADRPLYLLAPLFAVLPPLLAFVVIPVGQDIVVSSGVLVKLQVADLHVGILFVLAVASLSAYGLAFGGWASNSKFPLLGGVRAMAQMVSYEVGMVLVILALVMSYDSVSLRDMVSRQAAGGTLLGIWDCDGDWIWGWGLFHQPLAFVLFAICALAENNRLPFDLPECESELVGGYHTEYSSMGFGMFFQGEYIAMMAMGGLLATMFLGGWHYPGYAWLNASDSLLVHLLAALIGLAVFGVKMLGFVFFAMWVRWTLPRFRWDQLMRVGWKGIIPLALANLVLTAALNLPAPAPAHEKPDRNLTAVTRDR
ncbi:MAG: NADH-quinone oxidoreductase subunit H [Planctomycetota bacterium]|nr:NADH-quinone oxidoreductase subunit H [Planctomycetota bacterium]